MKYAKLMAVLFLAMGLSSCIINKPVTATSNPIGDKVGKSSATCLFGIMCGQQDSGIRAAAKNGDITRISTVDRRITIVLGVIVVYETIVTGE